MPYRVGSAVIGQTLAFTVSFAEMHFLQPPELSGGAIHLHMAPHRLCAACVSSRQIFKSPNSYQRTATLARGGDIDDEAMTVVGDTLFEQIAGADQRG